MESSQTEIIHETSLPDKTMQGDGETDTDFALPHDNGAESRQIPSCNSGPGDVSMSCDTKDHQIDQHNVTSTHIIVDNRSTQPFSHELQTELENSLSEKAVLSGSGTSKALTIPDNDNAESRQILSCNSGPGDVSMSCDTKDHQIDQHNVTSAHIIVDNRSTQPFSHELQTELENLISEKTVLSGSGTGKALTMPDNDKPEEASSCSSGHADRSMSFAMENQQTGSQNSTKDTCMAVDNEHSQQLSNELQEDPENEFSDKLVLLVHGNMILTITVNDEKKQTSCGSSGLDVSVDYVTEDQQSDPQIPGTSEPFNDESQRGPDPCQKEQPFDYLDGTAYKQQRSHKAGLKLGSIRDHSQSQNAKDEDNAVKFFGQSKEFQARLNILTDVFSRYLEKKQMEKTNMSELLQACLDQLTVSIAEGNKLKKMVDELSSNK
nr:PREDICTED: uncharacterized protein LOC106706619 isoform X2 [Latimeria chalumnae]|eukprot:XP_014353293.1 PREDICTED: uncharacterized protein LOC106706619 isoform X2 [Latimeria chalumnae]